MIEIENVRKSFGSLEVLKGIDLTVEAGQVHAIMGPNGNGKSTLAKVIVGDPEYTVTEGEVLVDGQNILEMEPDERARLGWSQQRLADELGVSRQTVISLEKGRYDPSLPLAFRLAAVFGRRIEDLFTPDGNAG